MSVMVHLERSIMEVKTKANCLAHALLIAVTRVTNDPDYKAYRQGEKSCLGSVNCCRRRASISVKKGGSLNSQYRIVLYTSLRCDSIVFDGQVAHIPEDQLVE